jgi:hypothetical protein
MTTSSASSSIISAPLNSSSPTLGLINLHHVITIKLNRDNYLLWKAQLIPYLRGQHLLGYVDGTTPLPSQMISQTSESGETSLLPNPAYARWIQQDQIILSTIISSLSESLMTHIVGLSTAHDVWLTLERMFSSQSKARIMQIRYQLSTLKKGSLSVTEYFQKLKQLVDTLAAVHRPLNDFEVNSYLLAGLSSDYESMIASIQMLAAPMSLDELYGHLLTHEQRLTQLHPLPDVAAPSVNIVTTTPSNFNKGGRGNRSHNFSHGGRGNGGRSRGRGRGPGVLGHAPTPTSRPTCQVCHKVGHNALDCYHRYDHAYQGPAGNQMMAYYTTQAAADSAWYPDSGCTNHLTLDFTNLTFTAEEPTGYDQVYVGNGQGLPVHHTGSTHLLYPSSKFLMPNVLHVPSIQKNLLSVSQFTKDNNVSIDFHPSCFFVKDLTMGKVLLKGPLKHGLYSMPHPLPPPTAPVSFFGARASLPQWHYCLGHPTFRLVQQVVAHHKLPLSSNKAPVLCSACQQAKSHGLPFARSTSRASRPLEIIHSDVWGPAPVSSVDGFRYYVSFLDDFSKFCWFIPIIAKSEVYEKFLIFQRTVKRLFSCKIKSFQSDWGGEYRKLNTLFNNIGIIHRISCPHTHQQNGIIERKHHHIVETGLALLAHSSLPQCYWVDAFQIASFLINRLPTTVLKNKSPLEVLFHKSPDYSLLKVFGCLCWPCLRPYTSHKHDFRSLPCVFLGYSPSHKGYRCLHLPTNRLYISRNVIFYETQFPFSAFASNSVL